MKNLILLVSFGETLSWHESPKSQKTRFRLWFSSYKLLYSGNVSNKSSAKSGAARSLAVSVACYMILEPFGLWRLFFLFQPFLSERSLANTKANPDAAPSAWNASSNTSGTTAMDFSWFVLVLIEWGLLVLWLTYSCVFMWMAGNSAANATVANTTVTTSTVTNSSSNSSNAANATLNAVEGLAGLGLGCYLQLN